MGFDSENQHTTGQSSSNALIEKQIQQNEAELESKRKALFDTRLSIVKSQGKENWGTPTSTKSVNPNPQAPTELGKM